jgi:hypothetical protein
LPKRFPELDLPDARLLNGGLQAKAMAQKVVSALI